MSHLLNRATRRRLRRKPVAALSTLTAAAALALGGVAAPPAAALELPTAEACAPGQPTEPGSLVDCEDATDWIASPLLDAILGAVAPELGLSVADLNRAMILEMLPGGSATIAGDGFSMAMAGAGDARAATQSPLSGAVAIDILTGDAESVAAPGGLALSLAVAGNAKSQALPLGVVVTLGANEHTSTATALGGFASAVPPALESGYTTCTALFAKASVVGPDGDHVSSCTSVLFIFQQSQQGDGPVIYAIKNPLSLSTSAPFGPIAPLVGALFPDLGEIIGAEFIPYFSEDLVRLVMAEDGIRIESDLFAPPAVDEPDDDASTDTASATTVSGSTVSGSSGTTGSDSGPAEQDETAGDTDRPEPPVTAPSTSQPAPVVVETPEDTATGTPADDATGGAGSDAADPVTEESVPAEPATTATTDGAPTVEPSAADTAVADDE